MQEKRSWIVSFGPWIGAIIAYIIVSQAVGYLGDSRAQLQREARDRQAAEFLAGGAVVDDENGVVSPEDADATDADATEAADTEENGATDTEATDSEAANGEADAEDVDTEDTESEDGDSVDGDSEEEEASE